MTATAPEDLAGRPQQFCSLCGRPMQPDQEWCLECGAARTVIAKPPDWRVPVLVVGTVLLVIAALFTVLITQLGRNAGKVTVINTTSPQTRPTLSSWAPGLDGYTVVLTSAPSRAGADSAAARLIAAGQNHLGVLATRQHPQMKPRGVWQVYTGRYPTFALARAAAARATRHGQPQARPALVQRPGQG